MVLILVLIERFRGFHGKGPSTQDRVGTRRWPLDRRGADVTWCDGLWKTKAAALAAVQALALRAMADRLEHDEAVPDELLNVSFIEA